MIKGTGKGISIEDKKVIQRFTKTKKGDILNFKVIEVNDEYCLSELIELPLIKGKVIYTNINKFGINSHEWFEVGDTFEGRVSSKDINRTLNILPIRNLPEIKRKQKEEKELKRLLNGK